MTQALERMTSADGADAATLRPKTVKKKPEVIPVRCETLHFFPISLPSPWVFLVPRNWLKLNGHPCGVSLT